MTVDISSLGLTGLFYEAKKCSRVIFLSLRSNEYESAHLALLRTYQNAFSRYVIPCFVAPGRCTEPESLSCR